MQNGTVQFDKLIQFLETGWEIQPPVMSQSVRQTHHPPATVYHFRLHHQEKAQTMVVIVPTTLSLHQFFVRHNIDTVDIAWQTSTT